MQGCSAPTLLGDRGASPLTVDLFTDPTLFTVTGAHGAYNCIVMRISDLFSFVPRDFGAVIPGSSTFVYDLSGAACGGGT